MAEHGFPTKLSHFICTFRRTCRDRGVDFAVRNVIYSGIRNYSTYRYHKTFRGGRGTAFTYRGKRMGYFFHHYNNAWNNERTVEIPISWEYVEKARKEGASILEVGNVLQHYFDVDHEIVDKYEKGDGVLNVDIIDFKPGRKYDLIITISTLEHIGWDEIPFDQRKLGEPEKIIRALKHLRGLLTPGGKMVVTVPIGYNPGLDKFLKEGKLRFDEKFYVMRTTRDNQWEQVEWEDVKDAKFGKPFPKANAMLIGEIHRKK